MSLDCFADCCDCCPEASSCLTFYFHNCSLDGLDGCSTCTYAELCIVHTIHNETGDFCASEATLSCSGNNSVTVNVLPECVADTMWLISPCIWYTCTEGDEGDCGGINNYSATVRRNGVIISDGIGCSGGAPLMSGDVVQFTPICIDCAASNCGEPSPYSCRTGLATDFMSTSDTYSMTESGLYLKPKNIIQRKKDAITNRQLHKKQVNEMKMRNLQPKKDCGCNKKKKLM